MLLDMLRIDFFWQSSRELIFRQVDIVMTDDVSLHLQVLQTKVEKVGSGQAISEELEAMRLMTHCQVCHVRRKDTVIVKCWHCFCGECIKRNLEARNRKCPACSQTFGAGDVKQIYL